MSRATLIALAISLFLMILLAVTGQSYRSTTGHTDYATLVPVTAAVNQAADNQATATSEAHIATPRINLMRP